jgi:class 3 adenylate cyclase
MSEITGVEGVAVERMTQTGYLVLADISGFTSFVAQTELEHANTALSYLLETVVKQLDQSLVIAKLEGDAVFAYVADVGLPNREPLLDLIDKTYFAFRKKAADLFLMATCPCKACRAIPTLDLKFIVHYGDFILQRVAGIQDLLGTDVNVVHRLLKNHVAESTGWKGYALITERGLGQLRADRRAFLQQTESYEHLGEVQTHLRDMHMRYEAMNSL